MEARTQDGGRHTVKRGVTNREGEHRRNMKRESEGVQNKRGKGGGILGFARGLQYNSRHERVNRKKNSEEKI